MQSACSAAPDDWATICLTIFVYIRECEEVGIDLCLINEVANSLVQGLNSSISCIISTCVVGDGVEEDLCVKSIRKTSRK